MPFLNMTGHAMPVVEVMCQVRLAQLREMARREGLGMSED